MTDYSIPSFKKVHPGCIAVFQLDNSANHSAYADTALKYHILELTLIALLESTNLWPVRKQLKVYDTIYGSENTAQPMNYLDKYQGKMNTIVNKQRFLIDLADRPKVRNRFSSNTVFVIN